MSYFNLLPNEVVKIVKENSSTPCLLAIWICYEFAEPSTQRSLIPMQVIKDDILDKLIASQHASWEIDVRGTLGSETFNYLMNNEIRLEYLSTKIPDEYRVVHALIYS